MLIGILFTVLVSFTISLFGFLAFVKLFTANPRFRSRSAWSFAFFWFVMSSVWLCIAVADFLAYEGALSLAIIAVYILQVLVGASLVIAAFFLRVSLPPPHHTRVWLGIYIILYTFFLGSLFWYKLHPRPGNFFAHQFISPSETLVLYGVMFAPLFVWALRLALRALVAGISDEHSTRRFHLFAGLSLVILGIGGSVDEIGIAFGWIVPASRLVSLVASIFAYVALSALQEPDELVI